jgi:energy-coupling factor transport system ATP-binding protein
VSQTDMRRRIAETCYFMGIEPWYRMQTADLSGGQRQMLALASVLVMRPRVLLLDEPTSMLDPMSARAFVDMLARLNRELGITVLIATHTPSVFLPHATQVLRLSGGGVVEADVEAAAQSDATAAPDADAAPLVWPLPENCKSVLRATNLWHRYGKDEAWVLAGCDIDVREGEVRAIVGSNGCGKSTLISTLAGSSRPQRGKVKNLASSSQMVLPQNPKALFSCETVEGELMEWSGAAGYGAADARKMAARLGLGDALGRHPLDLSGGQLQLLGMAKLALTRPRLLLLDEPTKGVDARMRRELAGLVLELAHDGTTVVLSTHDLAFASKVAHAVSVLFDGQVILTEPSAEFFEKSELFRLAAG